MDEEDTYGCNYLGTIETLNPERSQEVKNYDRSMETAIVWQLYSSFLTIVILFTIAGNSLVCILITRNRALKSSINWLLFHLAIADLLAAVFFIPPCVLSHFIHHPGGKTGNILCLLFTAGTLGLGICLSVELSTGISCIRAILCHLTSISEPSTQVFVVAAVPAVDFSNLIKPSVYCCNSL
ncbi:unnamed protein product [Porites lobata]|uniref:G-protein coupled receptors family 1 profile domain-containing protein n=1 Tax=Porites lobata TaxID=104759 RepID=A0ABN8N230_9CNID|nr:unnamed protein product [Porites lobata]